MKALNNLAFERKQDGLTNEENTSRKGRRPVYIFLSLTMSPETSHLTAMSLSFSKQKIEKLLLTLLLLHSGDQGVLGKSPVAS